MSEDLKLFEVSSEEEAQLKDEEVVQEEVVIEKEPEKIVEQPKETSKEIQKEEPKKEVEAEKLVPLSALNEARWQIRQLEKKFGLIDDFKKILDDQKKASEPAPPDPTLDPIGAHEHKIRQIETQQKELDTKIQENSQRTENNEFLVKVTQLENNFKSAHSDYDKAFNFITEVRKNELQDLGITDPEAIESRLVGSAIGLSRVALQQGKNPAEVLYNMAKRYGYKHEESKKDVISQDAVLKAAIKDSGKDTLSDIEKGQNMASKTLSGAGEVDMPLTMNKLLSATGEEFDKLYAEWEATQK